MHTNNSDKSLLVAMGTGANNMVKGYLCERLADQLDFALIDSLDQKEWDSQTLLALRELTMSYMRIRKLKSC